MQLLRALAAAAVLAGASHALAADKQREFPQQRPIRMVAPFAAGGSSDAFGRYLAPSSRSVSGKTSWSRTGRVRAA
jgi:tripartite-type tricarboxylate transporter receptor subunit TctC